MNRDIIQLREVITKLVPLLAGKGLMVTQRGSQAYVEADPVTRIPKRVNIPSISDNATPDFIRAIQGFIDHEVAHVLITDWDWYCGYKLNKDKPNTPEMQRFSNLHNIVEDTMIEPEMIKIFPGSRKNIADMRRHFLAKITQPALDDAQDDKERFTYLLVPAMRALAGHEEFQDFMDAGNHWKNPLIEEMLKGLSKNFLRKLPTLTSTEETYYAAKELEEVLYPPQPPAPPAPPSDCDDSGEDDKNGESQDKPEKQAGEGDGDGERDHSESEPGDDSDQSSGASGEEQEDDGENSKSSGKKGKKDKKDEEEPEDEETEDGSDGDTSDEGSDDGQSDDGEEADADDEEETESSGDGSDQPEDEEETDADGSSDDDADSDADDEEVEDHNGDADGEEDVGDDDEGEDDTDDDPDQDENDGSGEDEDENNPDQDDDDHGEGDDDNESEDVSEDDSDGRGDSEGDEDEEPEDGGETGGSGSGQSSEDDTSEQKGVRPDNKGDRLAIQTDDHDAPNPDIADEDDENEGGGIGSGLNRSMFDLKDDAFEEADTSSAMSVLIMHEAVDLITDADYTVFTREFDRIEPLEPPEQINKKWVPELEDQTRQMTGKMQKDIERMMASQSHVVKIPGYRTGRLHGPNLHRMFAGDDRVFNRKQEHKSKDTAVTLLIDNSGSMRGEKIKTAMVAGFALASTLERVGIVNEVLGFTTGDYYGVPSTMIDSLTEDIENIKKQTGKYFAYSRTTPITMPIYKSFDERVTSEVKKRIAYMANAQIGMGANIDGESLEYAAIRLLKRREKRKVILVLSDGQPAGANNCGPHLKLTVEKMAKVGIDCIGIGIMDSAVRRFYPKFVVLNSIDDLPVEVMRELRTLLS